MKTLKIMDMTLREMGSARDAALTFKEKLEIARSLDRLKVDGMELPPITGSRADQLSNKTIASVMTCTLSATVNVAENLVAETWESVRSARQSALNVLAPVSPVQMEYACHMKAPAMLQAITDQVRKCRFYCERVEFTAVDATRAERDFLVAALKAAVEAGANALTLCDTAGVMLPDEFSRFFVEVREAVGAQQVEYYVQPSNAMDMGSACAAAAVVAGADGVKCTAFSAGCPTLEQMARFVQIKGHDLDLDMHLRTTELDRTVSALQRMLDSQKEEPSVFDSHVSGEVAGICLDANDGIAEVVKVIHQLGYDLSDEDNAKVYESFRHVAEKKHFVGTREMDAIIASTAMQVPSAYRIDSYVINSGNVISATANLTLERDGEKKRSVAVGDGPVDAAFLAIEQIIGHHYELDDFQIQTVTEGREAMGSALVKLRANGKLYSGNGISTDIIGASIRAYISALNKIVYEET